MSHQITGLAHGTTKVLTLTVTVGTSVAVGGTHAWLVVGTSTGSGAPVDAVKASVSTT